MSSVYPVASSAAYQPAAERIPMKTLGQDDFLKLLVTQLTSQDPMAPKSDTEFIAQMAPFSSLEQAKTMQADIARLRADQQILQANSFLGRTVEIQVDETTRISGLVSAVTMEAGTPKLVVGEGSYDLNQVTLIAPASVA
jgi:flagellar basal-body rod modification protein FlgD